MFLPYFSNQTLSGVASPLSANHAVNGSVSIDLINSGNFKILPSLRERASTFRSSDRDFEMCALLWFRKNARVFVELMTSQRKLEPFKEGSK